jgi:hypothetical protein
MSEREDPNLESGSIDGRLERAKDAALGEHHDEPSLGDEVGEAAGGIAGVLLGAGIGSSAGPVGTLVGGIAGAIGGWWTGRAIAEAAESLRPEDDAAFREHYESGERMADRGYDDARSAYYLGHIASHNPNFTGQSFDSVEGELASAWNHYENRPYDWTEARAFVGEGYRRGVERRGEPDRRTFEHAEELERRLEERRMEEAGEVY